MIYYKIKKSADNHNCDNDPERYLIADELYTPWEMERYGISFALTEGVEISAGKTFWSFGSRFELAS